MALSYARERAGARAARTARVVLIGVAALFAATLAGAVAALFPPLLTAMLVGYLIAIALAFWRPEIGLALVMMLAAGAIPGSGTARIPLAGGAVAASDIMLLTVAAIAVLAAPRELARAVRRSLAVAWPVYLLLAVTVFAAWRSQVLLDLPLKGTLSELRTLSYWAMVPLVVAACRDEAARDRLGLMLVLIGVWLGAAITASSLTGIRFYEGGTLGELETVGEREGGVFRSQPVGMVFVIFAFLLIQAKWSIGAWRGWLPLLGLGLAALGILFNFGRGFWFATILAAALVALLVGIRPALKAAALLTLLGILGAAAIGASRPDVMRAAVTRATTVADEVTSGWSLRWRAIENHYARDTLRGNELLGAGLGASYRPRTGPHESADFTRYIHSSFYALWLKLGIVGPAAAVAIVVSFLAHALRILRRRPQPADRALLAASAAAFLVPAVMVALTQPEWMSIGSISLMATLTAFIVQLERKTAPGRADGAAVIR